MKTLNEILSSADHVWQKKHWLVFDTKTGHVVKSHMNLPSAQAHARQISNYFHRPEGKKAPSHWYCSHQEYERRSGLKLSNELPKTADPAVRAAAKIARVVEPLRNAKVQDPMAKAVTSFGSVIPSRKDKF